jgi:hypothetical protein
MLSEICHMITIVLESGGRFDMQGTLSFTRKLG